MGVPNEQQNNDNHSHREAVPGIVGVNKTSNAGESARKHSSSGLPSEEASVNEDDDEDD